MPETYQGLPQRPIMFCGVLICVPRFHTECGVVIAHGRTGHQYSKQLTTDLIVANVLPRTSRWQILLLSIMYQQAR